MEWWDNFLLQDQLSVLLFPYLIHPHVTTVACKTIPVVLPKVHAGGRLQLNNVHLTYMALHEMTWLYGVH